MTIEESIENYKKEADQHRIMAEMFDFVDNQKMAIRYAEKCDQLAEWLEELLLLREELKSYILYDSELAETRMFQTGYNKAIDEFYNEIIKSYKEMNNIPKVEKATANTVALGIATKLKKGEKEC